ncbi:MAG: flagellar biosynthesis protein FlhB [Gallionellales bacterium RIFCSPLOWO2_12_FULL_59_22]|nr:MAG: flagellar biosynthesis protein FlhB [Gallionellales bacterium RIFCSPLOWO2_02_FULL_59_110]OGT10598.1 MAG: flagellar biosynthesis protein FlhB [Gallionellales bacterium RIFCSPLOWO2_12_FULL_59_22]
MAEDSDLEKTEQPSERKLEKAREQGDIARSRELSTFAVLLAGGGVLWFMGSSFTQRMVQMLHDGLTLNREMAFNSDLMIPRLYELSLDMLITFSPWLLAVMLAAAFSPLLLNGWLFSVEALQPKFSKLNPISGIARMFSSNSLIELVKAIGKATLIGGVAVWVVWHDKDAVMALGMQAAAASIPQMGHLIGTSFMLIVGAMLLIVAIDVPYQLWSHNKKLRMTKEEVRQESKETEGNPEVKGRIRILQREASRRRMMAAIPTADVVVTNPTHYAVALKYGDKGMRAPVVVAKGSHLLALRIREIAEENHVPVLEAPPLARALHKHTELGESIPEALYTAVAEVLAYVYQLHRYEKQGGPRPHEPAYLPVPPGLDPEAAPATA